MLKEIENRRSIRKYQIKDVEKEKLLVILESARLAPSGSNTQPWIFIIVKSVELKKKLAAVDHNQLWMINAPVFIVCVADIKCRIDAEIGLDECSPEPELKQIIRDTAISMENLLLEAENQGLSTCCTAWFRQDEVRPILGIPKDKYVCGIITVGYSKASPRPRPRKPLNDLLKYEMWD
ncbi:MAG: nitroreductase family protein [Oscillibacter sp.]|nr:nitroreductase family protein [Oscillibacter sp.]